MKKMRMMVSLLACGLLPFAQQAWSATGDVSLVQVPTGDIAASAAFSLNAKVDAGTSVIAGYTVKVTFDPTHLQLDTSKGTNGVMAGTNPVSKDGGNLMSGTVSQDATHTVLTITDFVGSGGAGPGTALNPFNIAFKSLAVLGATQVGVAVPSLVDSATLDTLGAPNGIASTVTISTTGGGGNTACGSVTGGTVPTMQDLTILARWLAVGPTGIPTGSTSCLKNVQPAK